ncbi:Histone acetyltransferase hac-like 1 [Globisporangium polare]
MRDILDWVQSRPQRGDQTPASEQAAAAAVTTEATARALEIATAPTAPSSPTSVRSPLSRLLDDTPTRVNSPIAVDSAAIHHTPTATSSLSASSEFALPSLQQRLGGNYADLPSFILSMVDYNGQDNSSTTGGAGGSASGSRLFHFNRQRQASDSGSGSVRQRNQQEYNHNHFGLGDDWNPLPSSRVGDMNSFNNDDLQFTTFSPMHHHQDHHPHNHNHHNHQHSHFHQQLQFHHQLQQHDAAARFAARALGPFSILHRAAPSGPPQEIDLTVSSSESSDDDDDDVSVTSSQATTVVLRGSDFEDSRGEDGDEGEVEILQTTRTAAAATSANVSSPSTRYLTYASSLPPLRRKRRRQENGDGTMAATGDPAVNTEMFDGQRAESTNVSMENNETIERFKKSLKCSICLDVIEEMTSTICGHIYCGKCIRLAIRVTAKCPLCQRKLRPKDIHPLYF